MATPIGNLGDVSDRARHVISHADLLLAEDRRVAGKLLRHIGANPKVENYSDHNAAKVRPAILARLAEGQVIALTSDAGTPLISDPGYKLVDAAREQGSPVFVVPGPSAVTAALSISGLPTDRFLFLGFAPPRSAARKTFIDEVAKVRATLVFYESPRRLKALLRDLKAVLGDRPAVVARELTKMYEETRHGTLSELVERYAAEDDPRGEIVVLVGWGAEAETDWDDIDRQLLALMSEQSPRAAVDLVAGESGLNRREIYRRAMRLKEGDDRA
ncbi:16S rRNA (cytidine(1402)-2'-O)-methyltransferase [Minwuia sp.]|uniref:16S rRNA (cytidine(1402)-2'-O)-methyltransferase n=1 Tax=Minwuia sp. TaxID=2493630 RepID=UPI003A93BD4F